MVKTRFETLHKLKLKCRNLYVKKEKNGLLFFKKSLQLSIQPRNPTLQSKQPATCKIFTTQLLKGENQIMSKEIINFKLENI